MEEKFMKEALKEAKKAYNKLEVPVGAVIVKDGQIIARAHNLKETKTDTTKHAEILAIQKASKKLESWRLLDCEMYITLEPCSMCAGAIINSRIKKVYYGTNLKDAEDIGFRDDFIYNYINNKDNEGHIFVCLQNESDKEVVIKKGDRFAQGIFMSYLITDDDSATDTRNGGIGSTNEGDDNNE